MSEHKVEINWQLAGEFTYETYDRNHVWRFDNGIELAASAAPGFKGDEACVDPEEALVAAVSSCHMLTFLAIACRKKYVVDSYTDDAVGFLEKDAGGALAITKVILRPRVEFSGDSRPDAAALQKLHESAHEHCFIAQSVRSEIVVEAQPAG